MASTSKGADVCGGGDVGTEEMTPRPYQVEMYKLALERNTIVCLGTGTGKTFISILLMKDPQFARQLRGPYPSVAKRTFFLVPTRVLAQQQANQIRRHFGAIGPVKHFTGDMNVDFYDHEMWRKHLSDNYVIVMTLQILLDMLTRRFITWDNINLLIVDEVHWAAKKKGKKESGHAYKQLMNLYRDCPVDRRPRVLGLSASLINSSMKVELFDEAVKDLEDTYCAVVNTSDVAQLCGTNPKEIVWEFLSEPSSPSPVAQQVVKALEKFAEYLKKNVKKPNPYSTKAGPQTDEKVSMCATRIKKCLINIRNMLADPIDKVVIDPNTKQRFIITMTWMGVWCASKAVDQYIDELSKYEEVYKHINSSLSQMFDFIIKYLRHIKTVFAPELAADPKAALNTASPKMNRLLEILRKYKPFDSTRESNLCAIIFVNQRSVAKVLAEWLVELKRIDPLTYGFLNVDWVVGQSNRPGFESLVTSFTDKQQQAVIQNFRDKKLNVIVATSVLEEGLDVRQCNLVVRYDRINTFREYLQSKGRARDRDAHYYMITSDEDSQALRQQLNNFEHMERRIENLNNDRRSGGSGSSRVAEDEDNDSDDELQHKSPIGAILSSRMAISLLYQYCQKLPSDSFTQLIPIFEMRGEIKPFQCSVKMPVNSPLKTQINGKFCLSKKGAKKSAAFLACIELHRLGELDDRFLPTSKQQFIDKYALKLGLNINKEEIVKAGEPKPGTRNRNQIYAKRLAQVFTPPDVPSDEYYLQLISIKYPQIDCFGVRHLQFGAITGRLIANRCSFTVSVNVRQHLSGECTLSSQAMVDFTPLNAIQLNANQKEMIEKFHRFTFNAVLKFGDKSELEFNGFESNFNLLVVPLIDGSAIDWNFIAKIITWPDIEVKKVPIADRIGFTFDPNVYKDCVFYPWYSSDPNDDFKPMFYDSLGVRDLKPFSQWIGADSQYETFEHYYRKKYGLEICNKNQSLIEGRRVKNCAQLKPFVIPKVDIHKREYFVPELVTIHPYPSTLWRQALCLPAVLYRLNHLFLAEELRQTIRSKTMPSIGLLQPINNELILKDTKTDAQQTESPKRILSVDDLEVDCDGHPFDYGMPYAVTQLPSCRTKKQRTEYQITIDKVVKASNKHLSSLTPLPITSNNIVTDAVTDLLNFTDAVILRFSKCLLSGNGLRFTADMMDTESVDTALVNTDQSLSYGESFPFEFKGDINRYIRGSYDSRVGDPIAGPTADTLLKALTLLSANDAFNLERMETMGDSFLKLATTTFLYYGCPELDEGRLSYLRQLQICNCNLYYIGKRLGLADVLVANKWYPYQNWLAPYHHISDESDCQRLTDKEMTAGAYGIHLVNDKSIADAMEALIGAHLLVGGNKCALIFMQWLGLKVSTMESIDYLNVERRDENALFRWLPEPKSPIWNTELTDNDIDLFIDIDYNGCNLDVFERIIGYEFKNKAFLIQAFTHSSNYLNVFTDCYQRLEFLGDAILDYLITRHIFSIEDKMFSPGELTDLRSALVNNAFFASIAVKFRFHQFLKVLSPDLFHAIELFVREFEKNKVMTINNSFNHLTDEEVSDLEEVEVPKALGDIFESVAGAIWLDSGLSLDAVWRVYFKLLKPEIDYFSHNIPRMPIRELRERCAKVEFSAGEQITGRKIHVTVTADGRQYGGIGKNTKSAKIAASKCALKAMAQQKV